MTKVCAFTICSNNYIPYVEVLFGSFRRFHPDIDLVLCLVDERTGRYGDYKIIEAKDLDIADFESFCFQYTIMELNTAVKPFMFLKLFREFNYDQVIYFDPDIEFYSPVSSVVEALDAGASFVLMPHLLQPAENDAQPDDVGIMRSGVYNLGFLGCSNQDETEPILRWWARRLLSQCISAQDRGIFVDQKFMDLVPGFADHVRILRDPTLNVAYWNLKQRALSRRGKTWMIGSRPLKFFHFSGFDPYNTSLLSKHTRHLRGDAIMPFLQELMDEYSEKVRAHATDVVPAAAYAYGRFASGTPIHPYVREMFRELHVPWAGNPFENYESFLHEPAFGTNRDSTAFVVTNLMHYCWKRFPTLKFRFNLKKSEDVRDYTHWFLNNAHSSWHMDLRLIEPVAIRAGRLPAAPPKRIQPTGRPDVTVVGYLRTASGVGEEGRQMLRTLSSTPLRVEGHDVALNVTAPRNDQSCAHALSPLASGRVQIFKINADQLPAVLKHIEPNARRPDYRIAIPSWELEEFPEPWVASFNGINEIWAPSRFIQTALVRKLNKPVIHMPVNLTIEAPAKLGRRHFSLPEDRFLFFFSFDFLSYPERKNPRGLLAAFRRAFGKVKDRATLVLKSMNGDKKPNELAALKEELGDEPGIIFIDTTMTRAESLALIDACDCVVTLHRSEGVGLLVAEAMMLGKPVISTDYSATTELVTPATGFPVGHQLIRVEKGQYPFAAGVWADPDIEHAAWLMRFVYANPDAAAAKVARGKLFIEEIHGTHRTAELYLGRLKQLGLVAAVGRQTAPEIA